MKLTTFALAIPALLAFASCVAQERYYDASLSAKHYQNKTIENDRRVSELEDENRRLRAGLLQASEKSLTEAGFSSEAVDERLRNLSKILAEIGGNPGDVTKFSVDGGYVYRMKDSIVFGLGLAELSEDGKKILARSAPTSAAAHTARCTCAATPTRRRSPSPRPRPSTPTATCSSPPSAPFPSVPTSVAWGKIGEEAIVVMGFGSHDPVASNDSPENKQKNRRVDIFVADAEAGAQK